MKQTAVEPSIWDCCRAFPGGASGLALATGMNYHALYRGFGRSGLGATFPSALAQAVERAFAERDLTPFGLRITMAWLFARWTTERPHCVRRAALRRRGRRA